MPSTAHRFNASQQAMIHLIATAGPLSRTRLARALGVGKPALTALTRTLIEAGIVLEAREEADEPRQGRPSMLLAMNPDYGYFAGVSITLEQPVLVLVDLTGQVTARLELPFSRDPETVATQIADGVDSLLADTGIARERLLGIGVAVSGLVDAAHETCLNSTHLDWHNVPLARLIREKTGLPAYLENDAKTAATREKLFGEARPLDDFAVITIGDGVGCASFIDGKLRRGHNGGAGEIAHTTVEPGGRPCKCGKRGCLDTVAAPGAILLQARNAGMKVTSIGEIEILAARNDPAALDVLHRAGATLGSVIAHLVQVNDPQAVFIIDTSAAVGTLIRTLVQQTVTANVLPDMGASLRLVFSRVAGDFWSQTAASVAAHKFFVPD
jgi:predicted NBD/HSP70 family sugar kinase